MTAPAFGQQGGRVFLLVLDSVGCGALPHADRYGDAGSDTLGHTAEAAGGLSLPNMESLGLGNIHTVKGVSPAGAPEALWGKMAKKSPGKDTQTGHWEIAGHVAEEEFRVFPDGFPRDLMAELEAGTGVTFLGNKAASGTVIIEELGREHMDTHRPIIYTSADSVLQIAAHEEIIPLERLYEICEIAGAVSRARGVARVIARPFVGSPGAFKRTYNRRDYAVPPPGPTMLDTLDRGGVTVTGVGKIGDIFAHRGVAESVHTEGNDDGARVTLDLARDRSRQGLVFVNFVDFDMLYGHRRNAAGYAAALESIDGFIGDLRPLLGRLDLVIVTADHGNDPTFRGTDHTSEYVPVLIFGPSVVGGQGVGTRETMADVAETVLGFFGFRPMGSGRAVDINWTLE
jgi:phosphopentomutase